MWSILPALLACAPPPDAEGKPPVARPPDAHTGAAHTDTTPVEPLWERVSTVLTPDELEGQHVLRYALVGTLGEARHVVVEAQDQASGRMHLVHRRLDPDLSAPIVLTTGPDGDHLRQPYTTHTASLVVDPESAQLLLTAKREADPASCAGGGPLLQQLVVGADGALLSALEPLDGHPATACLPHKYSQLALDLDRRRLHACWTVDAGDDELWCRERGLDEPWPEGPPSFPLEGNAPGEDEDHVSLALRSDGSRAIAYRDRGEDPGTLRLRLEDSAGALLLERVLGLGDDDHPVLADTDGSLFLVWQSGGALHLASCGDNESCAASETLEAAQTLPLTTDGSTPRYPQLAASAAGDLFLLYDAEGPEGLDVGLATCCGCADDGAWALVDLPPPLRDGNDRRLTLGLQPPRSSIAVDELGGTLAVAWVEDDGSEPPVARWVARYAEAPLERLCPR